MIKDYDQLEIIFVKKVKKFFSFLYKYFYKRKRFFGNNYKNFSFLLLKTSDIFLFSLNKAFKIYLDLNIPFRIINHSIMVALNSFLILIEGTLSFNYYKKYFYNNLKKIKKDKNFNFYSSFFENIYKKIINYINYQDNKFIEKFYEKFFLAALFHDIAKNIEIKNINENHAEKGYIILKDFGLFFESIITKEHLIKDFENGNISIPSKIINLSDKMVKHSKIVSIEERFFDLKRRYKNYAEKFSNKNLFLYKNFYNNISIFNSYKKLEFRKLCNNKIILEKLNRYLNIF